MLARVAGGVLSCDIGVFRVSLGHGGVRADKLEGDGATPCASLPLRRVFYRADREAIPSASVPVEPLCEADGWCDAPGDPRYNRRVALPYSGRHERLWRQDGFYDLVGVLGWNDAPVVSGRGSAIFLHGARADYAPTEGCIALAMADLRQILAAGLTAVTVEAPDRG